jgi:L-threonylcarbamoyladenylate synthase
MTVLTESQEAWKRAAEVLQSGGLVVFPTDTVYGVGCDPRDPEAIGRVYQAKGREHTKAIPLLLSDVSHLNDVASEVPDAARALGSEFWPGALTLVVWRAEGLPAELGGGDTIAVRVPNHEGLRGCIEVCGGAVAATSANLSGQPDATDARQAEAYLGSQVDLIVDGGPSGGSVPSTVVNCTVSPPRILRVGAISVEQVRRVLERLKIEVEM